MNEFAEYLEQHKKLYTDMYLGDGKENPPMTTRMALQEERTEAQSKLINKILWASALGAAGVIGELVKSILHL